MTKLSIVKNDVNLGDVYNVLRKTLRSDSDKENFMKTVILVKSHDHEFIPWIERSVAAILALVRYSEFESYEQICSRVRFIISDNNHITDDCSFELNLDIESEKLGINKDWIREGTDETWISSAIVYTVVMTWLALSLGITPEMLLMPKLIIEQIIKHI